MVQNVATKKLVDEDAVTIGKSAYDAKMKLDKEEQRAKKGWKKVDDSGFGGNLSQQKKTIGMNDSRHLETAERFTPTKQTNNSLFEQRATVKKE